MTSATVEFDPFSEEYFNDPSDVYRRLRDEAPVYYSERYGFYALSRFDDVVTAHRDWQGFSSSHGVDLASLRTDPEFLRHRRMIIMMDPPEHDVLRALVSRVFTPRAMTAVEPMVREVIESFLTPLEDRDEFDVVAEFSAPFPMEIIARMLGVPQADRQQLREWQDASLHRDPGALFPNQDGIEALGKATAYYADLVAEKRRNPGDDMLSRLTQATIQRDDGTSATLTDLEIIGFAGLLGGAGAETVTKLIGNAIVLFHRNPGQWQRVVDDPGSIPKAVEEILRVLPPSQYQGRYSMEERTFEGGTIPAGFPCCSSPARRLAIRGCSTDPMTSTSTVPRVSRSGSATVCTAASERRWRGWRAASRSRSSSSAGPGSTSTRQDFGECRCPMSPDTRTSRSASLRRPVHEHDGRTGFRGPAAAH